jgi:hypothetical protein
MYFSECTPIIKQCMTVIGIRVDTVTVQKNTFDPQHWKKKSKRENQLHKNLLFEILLFEFYETSTALKAKTNDITRGKKPTNIFCECRYKNAQQNAST